MNHSLRIVLVNAGLLVAGALFGALAGMAALAVAVALTEGLRDALDPEVLVFGAFVGALFGGVLFPSAMWLLLRRVPLGLAVLGTVAGTVAGGVLGWVLPFPALGNEVARGLWGGVLGFACACLLLRLRASRSPVRTRGVT
jgi:hypothetical protein